MSSKNENKTSLNILPDNKNNNNNDDDEDEDINENIENLSKMDVNEVSTALSKFVFITIYLLIYSYFILKINKF